MNNLFLRNRLCIPVYGCNRGIIYDLTRSDYHFVPKLLAEHINTLETINFQFVKGIDDLTHWIGFLKEKEIIFEIDSKDEAKLFPPVCTAYHSPFDLTTLLIHDELDATVLEYFTSVYLPNISVIITDFTKVRLTTLLCILDYMEIDSINIYLTQKSIYEYDDFRKFDSLKPIINVYVFNKSLFKNKELFRLTNIHELNCSFETFSRNMAQTKLQVNYDFFFEAYNYHNYYSKKLYIDKKGFIKNGLNNKENFGNINTITHKEFMGILGSPDFKKFGHIKKENTLVCKDCEFKYMCVDPRVPKQNKNGKWYHEEECSYNPYISKWSNEENYKTLAESGVTIDQNGEIKIDKKILSEVFETIWGK